MKKIIVVIYLIFISLAVVFPSQNGLKLTVNYFDKRIYYPESTIKIKVTVSNGSAESYSFNLAEIHSFNFLIKVKNLKNISLDYSEKYILQHNLNRPVFYRQVTLMPGEEYSFISYIDDYTSIDKPGIYIIQAEFFPDFGKTDSKPVLISNVLTLSVRPSTNSPILQEKIDQETGEILRKVSLPPDEVVTYLLTARQRSEWNKFFLYLDLESLMLNEPRLEARYRNSDESERISLLQEYKNNLQNQIVDNDILLVPSSFQVMYTSYTPSRGKVLVREAFKNRTYTEFKEYTYFLHKLNGFWTIYNYEIRNIGTE